MKSLITILLLAILTGCAKDAPTVPSQPSAPLFDPLSQSVQYIPQGTIPREPVTFVWSSVPHAVAYTIEYQRDVLGHPGAYQYWSARQTSDTTITVPLPDGVINAGRWRVIPKGPDGVNGITSTWMHFEFQ